MTHEALLFFLDNRDLSLTHLQSPDILPLSEDKTAHVPARWHLVVVGRAGRRVEAVQAPMGGSALHVTVCDRVVLRH